MNPEVVERIVWGILLGIIAVLSFMYMNRPNQRIRVIEDLNNPAEITPLDSSLLETQYYPSPNGSLSFNAHWIQDKNVCLYDVTDTDGKLIDVTSILGFKTIYCSFESGKNSSFEKWVDENSFLISENYRTMYLVDLVSMSAKAYETGNPNYIFRAVNESFDYWVFQDGPTGPYVLLDSSAKVIKVIENKTYRSGDGVLNDKANQGFLFISKVNSAEGLSIYFDFLPLDSKILKRILKTEPVEVPARGCNSNGKFESVPGEIIFVPGDCSKVADKYLSTDGRVHIIITDDTMAYWNTYGSQKNGFIVTNHPSDWYNRPTTNGLLMSSDSGFIANGILAPGAYPDEFISIESYPTSKDVDEYFSDDVNNKQIVEKKYISIGAHNALSTKSTYIDKNSGTRKLYYAAYIQQEGRILLITSIREETASTTKFEKIFDTVVGSIKIIDDNSIGEKETLPATTSQAVKPIVVTNIPAGWTTYTNEEKRFGFAYPVSWDIFKKNDTDTDKFGYVNVFGDEYEFTATYIEHGIEQDGVTLKPISDVYVSGKKAKAYEASVDANVEGGLELIVGVASCNYITFFASNKTSNSKDMLYKLISTAVCE